MQVLGARLCWATTGEMLNHDPWRLNGISWTAKAEPVGGGGHRWVLDPFRMTAFLPWRGLAEGALVSP